MRAIIQPEDEFDVPDANATNGAAKDVSRFACEDGAVQYTVSSGSYELQGTIDGSNWVVITGTITATGITVLTHFWRALRIRTVTAGNLTASFGAHEHQ